jgi:MYXO-CTERM domain-containing protein
MKPGMALLSALLVAALVPTASAEPAAPADEVGASVSSVAACAAPPCGYIVPQLALDFPDKPLCKAATLGGDVDLSTCMPLPGPGESVVQEGVLRWYWDITQDGTYPIDPMVPIVIAFSGTATNPEYLSIAVEPASFTLDAVAMASPDNYKPEGQQVWFWFEKPITVTITRDGDPGVEDLQKISNAKGVQKVFLKAKSNASGTYFKEAFGVEEFRFDATKDPMVMATGGDSQDSPGLGPIALLGVLGLALLALRRRS